MTAEYIKKHKSTYKENSNIMWNIPELTEFQVCRGSNPILQK